MASAVRGRDEDGRGPDASAPDAPALDGRAPDAPAPGARRRAPRARAAAAVVLVVLGALLTPVAVAASWGRGLVADTDRYLAAVGPLAEDAQVREAVTDRVTAAVVDGLRLERLAADATSAIAALDLPPRASEAVESLRGPLVDAATGYVRGVVGRVVDSDAFATVWTTANREVHRQLAAVLRGDPGALARIDADGTLTVDLGGVVDAVRQRLSAAGFAVVDRLPAVDATFAVLRSADLVRAQEAYRALDAAATWSPWAAVALLAGAVALARGRVRALAVVGLAVAGAVALLLVALVAGRSWYAGSLPPAVQRPDVAVVVYDQVLSGLRAALLRVLAAAVVVAAAGAVGLAARGGRAGRALRALRGRSPARPGDGGDDRPAAAGPVAGGAGGGDRAAGAEPVAGA
ncbi:hypothetical protein [Cellulomonas sp. ES6]|uniref:hypothetical protein n=1 Tax=Cellulomonas sp. ES6 TaxID=3039384 RepID=UPI0024B82267|nr:hypothetical protein [Cellulomonas sp. ES6]WHP17181.1 hypothetical protein P9841_16595 [Cellulomonas sp. ES6]